jgi:hypothetical protein
MIFHGFVSPKLRWDDCLIHDFRNSTAISRNCFEQLLSPRSAFLKFDSIEGSECLFVSRPIIKWRIFWSLLQPTHPICYLSMLIAEVNVSPISWSTRQVKSYPVSSMYSDGFAGNKTSSLKPFRATQWVFLHNRKVAEISVTFIHLPSRVANRSLFPERLTASNNFVISKTYNH